MSLITKGSVAGGNIGGAAHPTGAWQNPNHTLTINELPQHGHYLRFRDRDMLVGLGTGVKWYAPYSTTTSTSVGGGGAHNHGLAWRPKALSFIVCRKDTL